LSAQSDRGMFGACNVVGTVHVVSYSVMDKKLS